MVTTPLRKVQAEARCTHVANSQLTRLTSHVSRPVLVVRVISTNGAVDAGNMGPAGHSDLLASELNSPVFAVVSFAPLHLWALGLRYRATGLVSADRR